MLGWSSMVWFATVKKGITVTCSVFYTSSLPQPARFSCRFHVVCKGARKHGMKGWTRHAFE